MKKVIRGALLGSLAFGILFSASTPAAFAGKKHPKAYVNNVDYKQAAQSAEINAGIKNGSLTSKEVKVLDNKQGDIARREARYANSGGKMTRYEARELNRMQDRADRKIDKLTTDRDGGKKNGWNKPHKKCK